MDIAVGQKATRTLTLTAAHVKTFAELTGDYNPQLEIHRAGLYRRHHHRRGGSAVGSSHQTGDAAQNRRQAPGWRNRAGRRGVVLHLSLSHAIINPGKKFLHGKLLSCAVLSIVDCGGKFIFCRRIQ
jgi:hypothetical protein